MVRIVWIFIFMFGVHLSGVICLLRGLVLGLCVFFLFVVLLNLNFRLLFNIISTCPVCLKKSLTISRSIAWPVHFS